MPLTMLNRRDTGFFAILVAIALLSVGLSGGGLSSAGQASPTPPAWVNQPFGLIGDVTADRQGNIYLTDWLISITSIAVSPKGEIVLSDVADHTDDRIQKFAPDGRPLAQYGAGELGSFVNGVALDKSGNMYVQGAGRGIAKITPTGHIATLVPQIGGQGIAVDPSGNIWLADENDTVAPPTTRIDEYSPSGKRLRSFSHPLA
jgi:DNA-binding beta-propeller fold protein YncE